MFAPLRLLLVAWLGCLLLCPLIDGRPDHPMRLLLGRNKSKRSSTSSTQKVNVASSSCGAIASSGSDSGSKDAAVKATVNLVSHVCGTDKFSEVIAKESATALAYAYARAVAGAATGCTTTTSGNAAAAGCGIAKAEAEASASAIATAYADAIATNVPKGCNCQVKAGAWAKDISKIFVQAHAKALASVCGGSVGDSSSTFVASDYEGVIVAESVKAIATAIAGIKWDGDECFAGAASQACGRECAVGQCIARAQTNAFSVAEDALVSASATASAQACGENNGATAYAGTQAAAAAIARAAAGAFANIAVDCVSEGAASACALASAEAEAYAEAAAKAVAQAYAKADSCGCEVSAGAFTQTLSSIFADAHAGAQGRGCVRGSSSVKVRAYQDSFQEIAIQAIAKALAEAVANGQCSVHVSVSTNQDGTIDTSSSSGGTVEGDGDFHSGNFNFGPGFF